MAQVSLYADPSTTSYQIIALIEKALDVNDNASLIREAMKDMAKEYAEQWAIDNLDAIYHNLNAEAISNLIMVEVAKQVKNNIVEEK